MQFFLNILRTVIKFTLNLTLFVILRAILSWRQNQFSALKNGLAS